MPYSQMYQHYQDPSYGNQQQPWDEVDFTNLQPPITEFKNLYPPGYYDLNSLESIEQNAGSPNYSQFLNFDQPEIAQYPAPSESITSDSYYRTSPSSADISRQSTNYPLKIEPGVSPNGPFSVGGFGCSPSDCIPQEQRPEPSCVQLASLAEIEDCNAPPCLSTSVGSSVEHDTRTRLPLRRVTTEPASKAKSATDREKKPRNKRAHKNSESEDESANIRAKQAHSVVERRYRDNLNGKIMQLHRALSATESTARMNGGMSSQDFYALREHRGKVRKSDVMTDAMNYVHQSEVEIRHMTDEITRLNDRVKALEKLIKCEDCTLLKQMVRLQLQQQQMQQQ